MPETDGNAEPLRASVDRSHSYTATVFMRIAFLGLPLALFGVIYGPWIHVRQGAVAAGLLLLLIYLIYLLAKKPENLSSTIGPLANALGPWIAILYANSNDAQLADALKHGGDTLIQLSFFFSSYAALFLFMLFRLRTHLTTADRWHMAIGLILTFLLFIIIMAHKFLEPLPGIRSVVGPLIFEDHQNPAKNIYAPPLTWFTMFRVACSMFGVSVSIWATNGKTGDKK